MGRASAIGSIAGPSGSSAIAPLNVTIGAITVQLVSGTPTVPPGSRTYGIQIRGNCNITIPYTPPGSGTFKGIYVQIEAPDQSSIPSTPLDGSVNLDGTTDLSGPKKPYTFGPLAYADTGGTVTVSIPTPDSSLLPMVCRARLISYSDAITNDAHSAPNVAFSISPVTPNKPGSATAYCENPTISVAFPATSISNGKQVTTITVQMTPPNDPKFAGTQYTIVTGSGVVFLSTGLVSSASFDIVFDTPNWEDPNCILYAPGSDGTHVNPIVPGITPGANVLIGIGKPTATAIISASASAVIFFADPNGAQDWAIPTVEWTDMPQATADETPTIRLMAMATMQPRESNEESTRNRLGMMLKRKRSV
jgi:hypothetical protein